jgi:hypothetical protein
MVVKHPSRATVWRNRYVALAVEALWLLTPMAEGDTAAKRLDAMIRFADRGNERYREIIGAFGVAALRAAAEPLSRTTSRWQWYIVNERMPEILKMVEYQPTYLGLKRLLGTPADHEVRLIKSFQDTYRQQRAAGRSARRTPEGPGGRGGRGSNVTPGVRRVYSRATALAAGAARTVCCQTFADTRELHWRDCATKGRAPR